MKWPSLTLAVALLMGLACAASVSAWEVDYSAASGVLPAAASPPWLLQTNNGTPPSMVGGTLRMQNSAANTFAYYSREPLAIDAGVPVTMEARMRVDAASSGAPRLSIQTRGCYTYLAVYTDHVAAADHAGGGFITFSGDFTTFRTIRVAYNGQDRAYAWVDGVFALSWKPGNFGQSGVNFGSYLGSGAYDSYWQYVAYSKQFLPIPEPSSLLALVCPIIGMAGLALRRRDMGDG